MKQSGRKCYFYTLATKMAVPGGEIYVLFHTSNAKFPSLSHAKTIFRISLISCEWYVTGVLSKPKKMTKILKFFLRTTDEADLAVRFYNGRRMDGKRLQVLYRDR